MLRMSRFAAPGSHPHPYRWGTPAGLELRQQFTTDELMDALQCLAD
jgi:hypothetical protein